MNMRPESNNSADSGYTLCIQDVECNNTIVNIPKAPNHREGRINHLGKKNVQDIMGLTCSKIALCLMLQQQLQQ